MKTSQLINSTDTFVCCEISANYSMKLKNSELPAIHSSKDVFRYVIENNVIKELNHRESFIALYLNRANKVLGYSLISIGGIAGTVADPRLIFQIGLLCNTCSIVLCHNHPSGNAKPSEADIKLTQKLKNAGQFLDIQVIDHLIITDESFYSFADEGIN